MAACDGPGGAQDEVGGALHLQSLIGGWSGDHLVIDGLDGWCLVRAGIMIVPRSVVPLTLNHGIPDE